MRSKGEGAEFTANDCNEIHPLPTSKKPQKQKKPQEISSSGISSTFEEDNYFNVPKYNTADVFSSKDY